MEKRLIHGILGRIRHGAVTVRYWDGSEITYGAGEPYFVLTVHSPKAIRAILRNMSIGFGESYMDGLIDIEGDIENVGRLVSENSAAFNTLAFTKATHLRRLNRPTRQKKQIQHHYDLGNDFYRMWLDTSMTYSCAYFQSPTDTLEQAQAQKVAHILKKLQLGKGHRLLDIGSGWGTLLITAAKEYGITGLGVTLSEEQLRGATAAAKDAGVDDLVHFELANYQDLPGRNLTFDRILSVGMFEHVGRGNQKAYFQAVEAMLVPGGVSLLHTITNQVETKTEPWIDKYIFPGGYLPAAHKVVDTLPHHNLQLLDYENLRIHYALTLEEWLRRFEHQKDKVLEMFDERFYRMWRLYLASSAAGFRYGDLSLSQYVFSKGLNNDLPLTRDHIYRP